MKKWFIAGLTALVVLGLAVLWLAQPSLAPKDALASLQQVDDYPLFVLTYPGDYGFKQFLQTGQMPRQLSFQPAAPSDWACSVFAALNEQGNPLLGRNFDWFNWSVLLLYTHPSDGYASASTVDVSYLGYDARRQTWRDRQALLAAPYWPFDGMNEAGLAVGMMAVPTAQSPHDPSKVTIGSLHAIRLMLDYAKNVDEAITLLQNYNIDFGDGPPIHYLIADATRNAAVIEFVAGEMRVLRHNQPWQVSTNFIISVEQPVGADSSCWRYNQAYSTLEQATGNLSLAEAMALLQTVSQNGTIWSVVYGLNTGDIQVAVGRHYDRVKEFTLPIQDR